MLARARDRGPRLPAVELAFRSCSAITSTRSALTALPNVGRYYQGPTNCNKAAPRWPSKPRQNGYSATTMLLLRPKPKLNPLTVISFALRLIGDYSPASPLSPL